MSVCGDVDYEEAYERGYEAALNDFARPNLDYEKLCREIAVQIGVTSTQGAEVIAEFGSGESSKAYALLQLLKKRYAVFWDVAALNSDYSAFGVWQYNRDTKTIEYTPIAEEEFYESQDNPRSAAQEDR